MSGAAYCRMSDPNDYEIILSSIRLFPGDHFACIDKDVDRTISRQDAMRQSLRNVLVCYAVRNPRLLYCQGLNNIVMSLLRAGYSEQEAFWTLAQLVERVLPPDFYFDMRVVMALVAVLKDLLIQCMPELWKYTVQNEVNLEVFLVEWLVTLFTKDASQQLSQLVMELLVMDGVAALIGSSMAILKLVWSKVKISKERPDSFEFVELVRSEVLNLAEVKEFRTMYNSIYLNQRFLGLLLDSYLEYLQKDEQLKHPDNRKLPKCSQSLPACLHVL